MATLTGSTIASTYKQLLKVTSEGIGADASAKYIEDGLGTDSALSISTTRIGIGTAAPSTILEIAGAHTGGLGMLHLDSTDHAFITLDSASSSHDSGIFFKEAGTTQMRLEFDASENAINFHDSIGGASRMVVTQAGNVGIGVVPSQKLDIGAGHILLDNTYGLYFGDTEVGIAGTTATDAIQFFTSNQEKMRIDASGNVGIGAAPNALFDLTGTDAVAGFPVMRFTHALEHSDWDTDDICSVIETYTNDSTGSSHPAVISFIKTINETNNAAGATTGLSFGTNTYPNAATEKMRITNEGNVGIGVVPSQKLDIGAGHILLDNTYGLWFGDTQVGISGTTATDAIQFITSNAVKMTLNDAGRFGIGGTPSTHQLEVHGADWDTSLLVKASGANSGMTFMDSAGNKDVQFMAGTMSLKVLINTTSRMKIDDNSRISLSNNDGNTNNTVFGYHALTNAGTVLGDVGADHNVAVGHLAMGTGTTTTAEQNVAVGINALEDITTGDHNIAIGSSAGANLTTANSTVFIGSNAGQTVTVTGGSNVSDGSIGIGKSALAALTSGGGNIAIGFEAGKGIVDSSNNLAIGYQAMLDHVRTDTQNIAIGNYALDQCTEDAYNTAVGYQALTEQRNVNAGSLEATYNTALGWKAGDALVGHGDEDKGKKNTFIGASTDADDTTGYNQTVIGYGTTGVADNTVTLGNADVTAVYMGSDSGARVYCKDLIAKKEGLCNISLTSFSSTGTGEGATIYLNRSNHGTLNNYAALDTNDVLGDIIFSGSDTDSIESGASINVQAAETWDSDSRGTQMTFQCVPSGANSTTITNRLHIAGDGTLTASSSNDISDEELKENIENVENGLDTIKKLQGRTFTWKESAYMPSGKKYGLIAQELEKILPDLVHDKSGIREKEDGSYYKSIQMSGVIPVLIEAVKELSAKVEALENK